MEKEAIPESVESATQNALRLKVAGIIGKWQAWLMPDDVIQIEPIERDWPSKMYGAKRVGWDRAVECGDLWGVPDFPSDLNACAEFERTLTPEQRYDYTLRLLRSPGIGYGGTEPMSCCFPVLSATAEQRCRAFVEVMGGPSVGTGGQPACAFGASSEKSFQQ